MIDYAVNYQYIVTEKCENRAKPQLSCNGKCYLTKELSKTENPTPKQITKYNAIDVFLAKEIWSFSKGLNLRFATEETSSKIHDLYNSDYVFTIFHPPLI